MNLGISEVSAQVSIGNGYHVFSKVADPVFPVKIFSPDTVSLSGPKRFSQGYLSDYIFQEMSYEAATGIRRGYIWVASGDTQPSEWQGENRSGYDRRFYTYSIRKLGGIIQGGIRGAILTFGSESDFSLGDVVHYESQIDERELVTVQMRRQFSYLPRIFWEGIGGDEAEVARLRVAIDKVKEGYRRSPPESVIDRCREAFTVIFQIRVEHTKSEDLGKLISRFEQSGEGKTIASANAYVVARMHGRSKAAEYKNNYPALHHRDADMVVLMLGASLVSMGWAEW